MVIVKKTSLYSILFVVFLTACSSLPKYQFSNAPSAIGYSEKKIENGIYKVTALLPQNMKESDRDEYMYLRLAELCQSEGFEYFDFSTTWHGEVIGDNKKFSITGYCYANSIRKSMNVVLDNKMRVEENLSSKSSLAVGDVIEKVGGKEVSSIDDVKMILHKINPEQEKIKIDIVRSNKKIQVEQLLGKSDILFGFREFRQLRIKFK